MRYTVSHGINEGSQMPRKPLYDKPMTAAERKAKQVTTRMLLVEVAKQHLWEALAALGGREPIAAGLIRGTIDTLDELR